MSRDPRPSAKKKRTPRQAWQAAERAEKRAIAQAVREKGDVLVPAWERDALLRPALDLRPEREPTWIDRRGVRHKVPIKVGH